MSARDKLRRLAGGADPMEIAKARAGAEPEPGKLYFSKSMPVGASADLARILALPRRPQHDLSSPRAAALAEMITQRYRRPRSAGACPCGCGFACGCAEIDPRIAAGKRRCIVRAKPAQAWALYEIGVAGGLVANLPVGTGKCLAAGAEVFDAATARRRDVSEPGPLAVISLREDARALEVHSATAFASGQKRCVAVALRDGSQIVASTDHPVLTARGWVPAAEIASDDLVAIASQIPEPARPTQASDDEVAFVAYMLSDGGCSQNQLSFTNADPVVLEDWSRCARALGYGISEHASPSRARHFYALIGRQRAAEGPGHFVHVVDRVRERWKLHGLAKHKRAHADIWGLPRAQVALFLNRFWACDGHVAVTRASLEVTLASEKLIDDLRFLLLRLGVRSQKHYKRASYIKEGARRCFDAWRLRVTGANALRFLDEVGLVLGKETACATLRRGLASTRRNPNNDVVPIGEREMHEICDELGCVAWQRRAGRQRARLMRWTGVTTGQYLSRPKFAAFCREFGYQGRYTRFLIEGVAWERVASVEPRGVLSVFDLTVPETHNFVANGIVVHNTFLDLLALQPLLEHGVNLALLLVPPNLLQQLYRDARLMAEHWMLSTVRIHGVDKRVEPEGARGLLHVLPYSRLSLHTSSDWVRNLAPDAIIADECHRLKDPDGAGSSRILRYFAERGDARPVRFCGWTGTLTDSSITEFGHHMVLALRERSPLPLERTTLEEWARAVDAVDNPAPPGELGQLCDDEIEGEDPTTTAGVRLGFGRRMAETLGVVISTEASAAGVELVVRERPAPTIPDRVLEALSKVRDCWVRPDSMVSEDPDEELVDAFQVAKVARELASGIFYRWRYPLVGGQPQRREVIKAWLEARRDWNRELRAFLRDRREWLDSPHLCEHAAQRFWGDRPPRDDRPVWESVTWPRWREMKSRVVYEVEACRVSDYLAIDAAQWARDQLGIVWYGMVEFGQWVSELSGLPMHGGGPEAEVRLIGGEHKGRKFRGEVGDRSIIASIKSHGVGRDGLQTMFCRQLVTQPPSGATIWEQLLGRTARDGQTAPQVEAHFYGHTAEYRAAYDEAVLRAGYVAGVTRQQQMILRGADQ